MSECVLCVWGVCVDGGLIIWSISTISYISILQLWLQLLKTLFICLHVQEYTYLPLSQWTNLWPCLSQTHQLAVITYVVSSVVLQCWSLAFLTDWFKQECLKLWKIIKYLMIYVNDIIVDENRLKFSFDNINSLIVCCLYELKKT